MNSLRRDYLRCYAREGVGFSRAFSLDESQHEKLEPEFGVSAGSVSLPKLKHAGLTGKQTATEESGKWRTRSWRKPGSNFSTRTILLQETSHSTRPWKVFSSETISSYKSIWCLLKDTFFTSITNRTTRSAVDVYIYVCIFYVKHESHLIRTSSLSVSARHQLSPDFRFPTQKQFIREGGNVSLGASCELSGQLPENTAVLTSLYAWHSSYYSYKGEGEVTSESGWRILEEPEKILLLFYFF